MSEAELQTRLEKIFGDLQVLWQALGPEGFQVVFCGGILANVVGNLTDENWRKFSTRAPCGRAGCDCHLKFQPLMNALEELRNDHKEHCPKEFSA